MQGQVFESYVFQLLEKEYSSGGIVVQLTLDSGLRPDFVIECNSKLIVVEAKAKERLTKNDVEQVLGYINEIDADSGIIFVADFTEVPESVEDYAVLNAVDIEYTKWSGSST